MVRLADFGLLMQKGEFVPQAVFDRPISYFAGLLKTGISEGHDDLDYYEGIGFLLKDAIPVVVMHYQGHPVGTTTMYLPFEFDEPALVSAIVDAVRGEFDVPAEAVSWRRTTHVERLAG